LAGTSALSVLIERRFYNAEIPSGFQFVQNRRAFYSNNTILRAGVSLRLEINNACDDNTTVIT